MSWPKLSTTLAEVLADIFPLAWEECERCHARGELFSSRPDGLEVWREHDDQDKPTSVAIVLCPPCGRKLVPPHPRLYSREWPHAPIPGVMELCRGCTHREGYRCTSPLLLSRGGPGLEIQYPAPVRAHIDYGRPRRGEWIQLWQGPPTACAGRSASER